MHKKQRKYYSILLVVFCPQGRRDAVCHLSFFSYLTNSREKGKEGREKCIAGALGRASTEAHCTREGEGRRNERVVHGWRALARLEGREKGEEGREKCVAGALVRASTEAHCTREGEGRRNERVVRGWRALARLNGSPLHSDHALLPPFSSLLSTPAFSRSTLRFFRP